MRPILVFLLLSLFVLQNSSAQKASIHEEMLEMKTYPFSDPNPVPEIGRIYPYFSFDRYTNSPELKKWKMVILENDYVKVYVCPDIGGKVWGAIEKSTGKEFLYFNHVVKFRDVAMRGPWTSGGLEYNFGDIGHAPSCSTPVDYIMKNNPDGSVSCVVGATDLPSGTKWSVEISVHPDKAYFETQTRWFNNTSLPCTYYHWMNAAAKASGNLEFIYPGNKRIGHGGEVGEWPKENARDLNFYESNNFGSYKSYHVLNSYSDFFGGYWHDDNFGFGHWGNFDDKPGKKLWIWGLSDQGMIWEDLLTDDDGQYIEFQAGKLFNQAANNSTLTPFKHKEFPPHDVDIMHEIWFPLKETGGMVAVSPEGILNVEKTAQTYKILFCALQTIEDQLIIKEESLPRTRSGGKVVRRLDLQLEPLEKVEFEFTPTAEYFNVYIGNNNLLYSSNPTDNIVDRPLEPYENFNWESVYGLYTKALELEKQRMFDKAMDVYSLVLEKDPGFMPAINRLALGFYRKMDYKKAYELLQHSLSIDTNDGEANYYYGLVNRKLGNLVESKSGFSIAAASITYRAAAYVELAKVFLSEGDYNRTLEYAKKALSFNAINTVAYQLMAIAYRKTGQYREAGYSLRKIADIDATIHFGRFERFLLKGTERAKKNFIDHITNELPYESYIDLAIFYSDLNCEEEAIRVLKLSPDYPVRDIWLAHLDGNNNESYIEKVISGSPELVFPFRNETAEILTEIIQDNNHWKFKYYLALIYWNSGLEEEALGLFEECGTSPDYAAFYLSKAQLVKDPDQQAKFILRAYELDQEGWRPAMALVELYLSGGKADKALPICEKFLKKYPEQSAIGLAYARILMKLQRYEESIEFLESYNVLPFEGATVGRDLYHEACIRLAYTALSDKQYRVVISFSKKALEWPVNLGVGKPYDVDERLENYLIARGYGGLDMYEKEVEYITKLINHPNEKFANEGSKLVFQLLALGKSGAMDDDSKLLARMIEKYPDNLYIEWARLVIVSGGDYTEAGNLADRILGVIGESMPYNTDYKDVEFKLISDLFQN